MPVYRRLSCWTAAVAGRAFLGLQYRRGRACRLEPQPVPTWLAVTGDRSGGMEWLRWTYPLYVGDQRTFILGTLLPEAVDAAMMVDEGLPRTRCRWAVCAAWLWLVGFCIVFCSHIEVSILRYRLLSRYLSVECRCSNIHHYRSGSCNGIGYRYMVLLGNRPVCGKAECRAKQIH